MNTDIRKNGTFSFLDNGNVLLNEKTGDMTREPWLMLMARRGQKPTETLCWGLTNSGSSFARIGTQEGDLINGFVHEDPYKTRLLGPYTYIADENDDFFTNTWYPVMHPDQELQTEYGHGTLTSRTSYLGVSVKTENFVPNAFDGLIQILTIKNNTNTAKTLRVYTINPINIGDARDIQFAGFNTLMMGGGFYDREIQGLVWRSHFGIPFNDNQDLIKEMFGKVIVHTTSEGCAEFSTKYEDFVGHYSRSMADPQGVHEKTLSGKPSEELTSSLSTILNTITLSPGEEKEIVIATLAESTEDYYNNDKKQLKKHMESIRNPALARALLCDVEQSWKKEMDLLRIDVPGQEIITHSFRWLQYQCAMVAALNRMKSRFHSGFEYGYGFRDILQDLLALLPYNPPRVRDNLTYVAQQMFSDGTVYHNFFVSAPGNKNFVACDDPLWFIFAVCEYVKETADFTLLEEVVTYADAKEGKPEASGSIRHHCLSGINRVWNNSREGLPFMFDADWNDDLSQYDQYLSVMTAQMLYKAFLDLAELCDHQTEHAALCSEFRTKAQQVQKSVNEFCIDTEGRYIRLVSLDKKIHPDLGSCESDGRTFFEPVAWAGYSGIATKEQFIKASEIAERDICDRVGFVICQADTVLTEGKLPEDHTAWKRNAPGKKENGGAFRHLESWYIASLCRFGFGEKACELFYTTLPAVCSENDPYTYAAERFVYPEYVSGPKSIEHGRAGHTWLTGTAPTRQRVLIESIFGLESTYEGLRINPCVSSSWKLFSAYRKFRDTGFSVFYSNPEGIEKGLKSITIDGIAIEGNIIPNQFYDKKEHSVAVTMGK